MSSEKHPNACEVIESVEENLSFGIAMEHTGSFSCDTEIQVFFPSAEKGIHTQGMETVNKNLFVKLNRGVVY